MRDSETELENEVYVALCAKAEVRRLGLKGEKGHGRRIRRAGVQ